MARKNPTAEYEIIVKVGPSGSMSEGTFGYSSIVSYYRLGRWDADMKADEERRKNPDAMVSIRRANA